MARNVEVKAWVADPMTLKARVAAIADSGPIPIEHDDTFFRCENGRLKLRKFTDGTGEVIFYRRPDRDGPKTSSYVISPTAAPDTLHAALTFAYDVVGRVVKHRTLYLVGRTRVHLDHVDQLGDLMELEVVLAEGESEDAGAREAGALMARLGIAADQLVEGAYVDLLGRRWPDRGE